MNSGILSEILQDLAIIYGIIILKNCIPAARLTAAGLGRIGAAESGAALALVFSIGVDADL